MGRRVVVGLGCCAIWFSSGCSFVEDGLGGVRPAQVTGPEEMVPPGGGMARPSGFRPAPLDGGSFAPEEDGGGEDVREMTTVPDAAAAVDAAPIVVAADAVSAGDDVAVAMDVAGAPGVGRVTYDRPACLSSITCGTQVSSGNRLAYPLSVAGGGNGYLVAGVAIGAAGREVQARFAGAGMTAIGTVTNGGGTCQVSLFGLAGAQGAGEITVVVSGAPVGIVLSAASFGGVDQVAPYRGDGYRSAVGTGGEVRVKAPAGAGEVVVDAACVTASDGLNVRVPALPSVEVFDALIGPGKEAVQSLRAVEAGAAATVTYRLGGAGLDWAAGAVSLRPAP